MTRELYSVFKGIDIANLDEDEKDDLLEIFMVTKNDQIRNHIAIMFSDLHFEKAVPYIIKKIKEKAVFHNNGTLVYALERFDMREHFMPLVEIICGHEYEPRLMAFGIIERMHKSVSDAVKKNALDILEQRRIALEETATDKGNNNALHFVEKTKG